MTITVTDGNGATDTELGDAIIVAAAEEPPPSNTPPTILTATVSPPELSAEGGTVEVAVQAYDDHGVAGASAQVMGDDASRTGLTTSDGSAFSGTLSLPRNDSAEPVTHQIRIDVIDAHSATDHTVAGEVTVVGVTPPPPPPPPPGELVAGRRDRRSVRRRAARSPFVRSP